MTKEQALRDWAATHHDTSGHSPKSCPACQVLDILEGGA